MSFLPAIIVMFMIFQFSAQDGTTSADLSYKISHKLVVLADEHLDLSLSVEEINTYADRPYKVLRYDEVNKLIEELSRLPGIIIM